MLKDLLIANNIVKSDFIGYLIVNIEYSIIQ